MSGKSIFSDVTSQQVPKRTKDKERKKKKLKSNLQALTIIADATDTTAASCSEIKNDGQCTSTENILGEPREPKDDAMVGTSTAKQSSSSCQDISIPILSTPSPLEGIKTYPYINFSLVIMFHSLL